MTGELGVVHFCFSMYKHLTSIDSFVVTPLENGNSTQVIFCRVVLLVSVQLLSANDCLFRMSVRLQFGTFLPVFQVICRVCVTELGHAARALQLGQVLALAPGGARRRGRGGGLLLRRLGGGPQEMLCVVLVSPGGDPVSYVHATHGNHVSALSGGSLLKTMRHS